MVAKKVLSDEEFARELRDNMPDAWRWFALRHRLIERLTQEKALSFEATSDPKNAYLGFQNLERLERNVGYLNEAWRRKVSAHVTLSRSNNKTHILHFTCL